MKPTWMNLYGAPTANTSARETITSHTMFAGKNFADKYNEVPELGSTYRGRVLMSQKIKTALPQKVQERDQGFTPWKRNVRALAPYKYPVCGNYVLRAFILSGSELPVTAYFSYTTMNAANAPFRSKYSTNIFNR